MVRNFNNLIVYTHNHLDDPYVEHSVILNAIEESEKVENSPASFIITPCGWVTSTTNDIDIYRRAFRLAFSALLRVHSLVRAVFGYVS